MSLAHEYFVVYALILCFTEHVTFLYVYTYNPLSMLAVKSLSCILRTFSENVGRNAMNAFDRKAVAQTEKQRRRAKRYLWMKRERGTFVIRKTKKIIRLNEYNVRYLYI